jgi:enoyl-CoA hydratase
METVRLDWDGGTAALAVLTLNRPSALNAMNTQMIKELLTLFREQAYNEQLRCIVITGGGGRFVLDRWRPEGTQRDEQ